jgi:hypothetical protein
MPIQLDVLVSCIELLDDVHLDALVCGDDDTGGTIELQELHKDEPSGACIKEEHFNTECGGELIKAMDSAGNGIKDGGFLIGEVVD